MIGKLSLFSRFIRERALNYNILVGIAQTKSRCATTQISNWTAIQITRRGASKENLMICWNDSVTVHIIKFSNDGADLEPTFIVEIWNVPNNKISLIESDGVALFD